uniref:PHD finger protein 10 n=1 Tax=Percolomonas cosmopolitus TaxID=63605 RepID=A0A7S1PHD6_9EUKA|mmetsp:Transcript_4319/g.16255  ORF Transcript_4319/g.16255 Transcript_4319/m.16255 type:complete len:602 (+) Transcript_4319:343-2148(+)|eukprot:CAMPEP_0117441804 /NCGR_PEP_ID=MMETSP0759-20121206/3822_1 /TAXON_ID=63605 /ORGANISM="Percolomonas cosmopolitus, Strain WS" /LENGTH=601 /DNA_ID=CAMNT_0005233667 /DNA_START=1831 /DNA_END=3636 /DNA_ORIENTATION=+
MTPLVHSTNGHTPHQTSSTTLSHNQEHPPPPEDMHHDYNSTTPSSLTSPHRSQSKNSTPLQHVAANQAAASAELATHTATLREVIIPAVREVAKKELLSMRFGPESETEKDIDDSFYDDPGGIPLTVRVRFENQERWSHDQERGTKSKRSTRSTYLDAPCYDEDTSNEVMSKRAHHDATDSRGNYFQQKEKVLSYAEYGRYEFCICHHNYENRPMIQCDNCDNWFHLQCVTFDDGAEGQHTDSFFCPNCMELTPDVMITMKKGHVPRKLPYIRLDRDKKIKQPKQFYHTALDNVRLASPPSAKRGRKRKAQLLASSRKIKRKKITLPEDHETLWDPHASRVEDSIAEGHYSCDIYGNSCKKPFKKYKDELLECNVCHRTAHTMCTDHNLRHLTKEHRNIWCCNDCKACWECQRGDKEDQGLLCDCCDRMFHMKCHKPPVRRRPKLSEHWYCSYCRSTESISADDLPYREDSAADSGNASDSFCEVCNKKFANAYTLGRHLQSAIHKTALRIHSHESPVATAFSGVSRKKKTSSLPGRRNSSTTQQRQADEDILPMNDDLFYPDQVAEEMEEVEEESMAASPPDDAPAKHTRAQIRRKSVAG